MSEINKKLSQIIYNGEVVNISGTSFNSKVKIIYRLNDQGTGWVSYRPSNPFSAVKTLDPNSFYIVETDSVTPFEIPGAIQSASGLTGGGGTSLPTIELPDSVSNLRMDKISRNLIFTPKKGTSIADYEIEINYSIPPAEEVPVPPAPKYPALNVYIREYSFLMIPGTTIDQYEFEVSGYTYDGTDLVPEEAL